MLHELNIEESEFIDSKTKYSTSPFLKEKLEQQDNMLFNLSKPVYSKERVLEMAKYIEKQKNKLTKENSSHIIFKLDDLIHIKYGITFEHLDKWMKFHSLSYFKSF